MVPGALSEIEDAELDQVADRIDQVAVRVGLLVVELDSDIDLTAIRKGKNHRPEGQA